MARRKKVAVWKPPYVTVEWLDACVRVELNGTPKAVLERAKLKRRESQGWLLRYDEYLTVIARDYDAPDAVGEEPEVGDIQIMPSILVLSVRQGRKGIQREQTNASLRTAREGEERALEGAGDVRAESAGYATGAA